jgi:ribose transport system substrate-binding protein
MSNITQRRVRRAVLGVAAAASAAALAACSASPSTTTPTPTGTGNDTLAATVATLSNPLSAYPVPTAAVTGVSKLSGKTVYYIPITLKSPQFNVTGTALTQAMKAVGASVQICDGGSNPSTINGCIAQATAAHAAAIVADSIPYGLGANSFGAARAAGIPVVITDQIPDSGTPADATLGYIEGAGSAMLKAVADWIAVDSGGTGSVIINKSTDSPSAEAYVAAAQTEFTASCSGCSVAINEISSANFPQIPSSTSAALLQNPNAGYVVSEFDQYLQPTLGGVQQTGRQSSIKGVSAAAQLAGLQMLADQNYLYAEVGQASAFQGWIDADAAIRLVLGVALPEYTIPVRIFTRDNIGSVKLTADAEASGEWYGPTTYPAQFKTLWGLS